MPILDSLERRALFRLTRALAFVFVLILTAALIIGAILLAKDLAPSETATVSYNSVAQALHPQASESTQQGSDAVLTDPIDLPFTLQPYFTNAANRAVLQRHLSRLDSSEREDYLRNMAEVVTQAKAHSDDMTETMNKFMELKSDQADLAKSDREARVMRQIYIASAAVSVILLIGLFSLILVMLAIERNTRKGTGHLEA